MDTQNNLKQQILEKIQKGELTMRPKAFFVAKIVVLSILIFITFILSVFLVSYTFFSLREGGHIFLLGFGGRGFFEFFLLFPWIILLVDVGLIILLDWLLKRFRFAYHNPMLYLFIGSLLVITVFGSIVDMTSFHKRILIMAEGQRFPVPGVGGFYSGLRRSREDEGLFRGEVTELSTSSFMMENAHFDPGEDKFYHVFTPDGFDIVTFIHEGDQVFVAGDVLPNGEIRAYGVRTVPPDLEMK
jgi:hypothetical protein